MRHLYRSAFIVVRGAAEFLQVLRGGLEYIMQNITSKTFVRAKTDQHFYALVPKQNFARKKIVLTDRSRLEELNRSEGQKKRLAPNVQHLPHY